MVRLLARVIGVGIETADMLVHEVLSRNLRDRKAVARYAGLTGSPDESGARRREKGLAKAGKRLVIMATATRIPVTAWPDPKAITTMLTARRTARSHARSVA
jgi:transposase